MHIVSRNFVKTLVWEQVYDVILWRHKQRTPNTNDYPMPLNEPPPWKVSAYATEPGPSPAGAGANARPKREAPLTIGVITPSWSVNRAMTFLMKILPNYYVNIKSRQIIGDDLCDGYMVKQQFFVGLGHSSGVLNLFPVKYPRVINQSARTPSKLTLD